MRRTSKIFYLLLAGLFLSGQASRAAECGGAGCGSGGDGDPVFQSSQEDVLRSLFGDDTQRSAGVVAADVMKKNLEVLPLDGHYYSTSRATVEWLYGEEAVKKIEGIAGPGFIQDLRSFGESDSKIDLTLRENMPCDSSRGHTDGSFTPPNKICLSLFALRRFPPKDLAREVRALVVHELAHYYGEKENMAAGMQDLYRELEKANANPNYRPTEGGKTPFAILPGKKFSLDSAKAPGGRDLLKAEEERGSYESYFVLKYIGAVIQLRDQMEGVSQATSSSRGLKSSGKSPEASTTEKDSKSSTPAD